MIRQKRQETDLDGRTCNIKGHLTLKSQPVPTSNQSRPAHHIMLIDTAALALAARASSARTCGSGSGCAALHSGTARPCSRASAAAFLQHVMDMVGALCSKVFTSAAFTSTRGRHMMANELMHYLGTMAPQEAEAMKQSYAAVRCTHLSVCCPRFHFRFT
jgi:hypothetical protein